MEDQHWIRGKHHIKVHQLFTRIGSFVSLYQTPFFENAAFSTSRKFVSELSSLDEAHPRQSALSSSSE